MTTLATENLRVSLGGRVVLDGVNADFSAHGLIGLIGDSRLAHQPPLPSGFIATHTDPIRRLTDQVVLITTGQAPA